MPPRSPARISAIALDAMGVIYSTGDDLRQLLIPFVRSRRPELTEADIAPAYRACYREGAPAETLWRTVALDPTVEDAYLASYQLTPGVLDFLKRMQTLRIPVFGFSNDVAEWAPKRRRLHNLDPYFAGWVVSGDLKSPKPNPLIYQRLLDMLPCPPQACRYVDDRIPNLEMGLKVGLRPVLFGAQPTASRWPSASSFPELSALTVDAAHP